MTLSDYETDLGSGFFDFWMRKSPFRWPVRLGFLFGWLFSTWYMSAVVLQGPFVSLLWPTFLAFGACYLALVPGVQWLLYMKLRDRNRFIEAVRNGESIGHFQWNEFGQILHKIDYTGTVELKNGSKMTFT